MIVKNQLTVEFGIVKDYPSTVIEYEGDYETGVKITIDAARGSASNIRINNVTRGEYIIIDDTKLAAVIDSGLQKYDVIEIDTTRGNKSARLIRDGVSKSVLSAIDISSKWIQIQKGSNSITATATGLENLIISISYTTRVLGV